MKKNWKQNDKNEQTPNVERFQHSPADERQNGAMNVTAQMLANKSNDLQTMSIYGF